MESMDFNDTFYSKALLRLPHGPGYFISRDPEGNFIPHVSKTHLMDSMESIFCQYLSIVIFPDALYIFDGFHAGPGQICFGSDYRRKADACVVTERGKLQYFNFHDNASHPFKIDDKFTYLSHSPQCPKRIIPVDLEERDDNKINDKDEDDIKIAYADCLTKVDPDNLSITYNTVRECDFFHQPHPLDPRSLNPHLRD
jgi:hypothetical protein